MRQASDGRAGLAELERETAGPGDPRLHHAGPVRAPTSRPQIRAKLPDQPLLFVSGYSETEAVKRTAPDAPLLAKPFRADTLHQRRRGQRSRRSPEQTLLSRVWRAWSGRFSRCRFSVAATPLVAQPTPASLPRPTDAARQLFERDWVLMNWALKYYDRDRDILLEPDEAQSAAEAFRRIADANGDGRVTPDEYRAAREFILARY